jgi:hypothetical protein
MKTIKLICVGFFLLLFVGAVSQDRPKKFLSRLKTGQIVSVKEVSGKYELLFQEKTPVGSKVIEIGDDYVVLEDPSGLVETRIHVTSIKSIARWQQPKQ